MKDELTSLLTNKQGQGIAVIALKCSHSFQGKSRNTRTYISSDVLEQENGYQTLLLNQDEAFKPGRFWIEDIGNLLN